MAKYVATTESDITVSVKDADLASTLSETKKSFDQYVKDQEKKQKELDQAQKDRDQKLERFQGQVQGILPQLHTAFTNINQAVNSLNQRLKLLEQNQTQHEELLKNTADTLKDVGDASKKEGGDGNFPKERPSDAGQQSPLPTQTPQAQPVPQAPEAPRPAAPAVHSSPTDASHTPEGTKSSKASTLAAEAQGSTNVDQGSNTNTGEGSQGQRAQDLQDALKNSVAVKILESIRDFLVSSMDKFEKFNDELRRTYHVNGETSAKIMDATLGARTAVTDSLGIHITVSDSIKAIKDQVLKNGLNATHLADSTNALVTGLDKFGVSVNRETLLALDNMKMGEASQRKMLEQIMAAQSGENTIRTDTAKLSQDFEKIVSLAQTSMKTGDETADMVSKFTKDVQQMVNMGMDQQRAQNLAFADLKTSLGYYGGQGQDQMWKNMAGFLSSAGVDVTGMSSKEMQKQLSEIASTNESVAKNMQAYAMALQQKGDDASVKMAMSLMNMTSGRQGHNATVGEAQGGQELPWTERIKDDISATIGGALTGAISFMWGVNGEGTMQDIVKKGFTMVILALNAQSITKAFPQVGEWLETTAKGTGALSKVSGKLLEFTSKGLPKIATGLKALAGPLVGILAAIGAVYKIVDSWKGWWREKNGREEAENEARDKGKELAEARKEMEKAYQSGDRKSYTKLKSRVDELEQAYDDSLGTVIRAKKKENESLGEGIGATGGGLTGAAAGFKLGSKFGGTGKGKLIAGALGALVGALGFGAVGGGIGSGVSDEDTEENRDKIRAKYYSSEGNIFTQEAVTHVGEGNKTEAVLPATKPERMKALADQVKDRSDIPESSREAFSAMSDSLGKDKKESDKEEKAYQTISDLVNWAASKKGLNYELHGVKDPYTGKKWEGFVCNELVWHGLDAIGYGKLAKRFMYPISTIVYGYPENPSKYPWPGLLQDPDWVSVPQDQIKPGMFVFTGKPGTFEGNKDSDAKPTHVGIASSSDHYWNASGSASIYSRNDPEGFLRTRTKNNGVQNSAWKPNRFKLAGYFKSMFGNYTDSVNAPISEPPEFTETMGDVEGTAQDIISLNPPESAASMNTGVVSGRKEATASTNTGVVSGRKPSNFAEIIRELDKTYKYFMDNPHRDRRLKQDLILGILGAKRGDVLNPIELERLSRNVMAESQEVKVDGMPLQFATMREGFENYIRQLEEKYSVLGSMDAKTQLKYLTSIGEFSETQSEAISMQKSMKELSEQIRELSNQVKSMNRDREVDRLRSSSMPMQSRIFA